MARKPWERENWHLTSWISATCLAFFMLGFNDPEMVGRLKFLPGPALQGLELWRFVTYPFIFGSPVDFFLSAFMLMILGSALEALWGSRQFLWFFLVSLLGGSAMGAILGQPLEGLHGIYVNLLIVYAVHFPEAVFLVWFVLPVKVKWLAMLSAAFLVATNVIHGLPGIALLAGTLSGLIFWWLRLRSGAVVRRAKAGVMKAAEVVTVRRDQRQEARQALETIRALAARIAAGGSSPDAGALEALELMKARVEAGVNTCPPDHFEADSDFCPPCNGFVECALRSASLLDVPMRKAGGKTATNAADAMAAYQQRLREEKRKTRISAAIPRPATDTLG